ncbi:MAG: GNAT family N-acetyltransferase [Nitrospirae bacterium]|nr:GNAT family N-acetyltransferase [Nitrospirota bacterium]
MSKDEVGIAINWASAEGWNPGNYDITPFYEADNNGFFIGLIDNEPVGCISAVSYGRDFGFIGFYIVRPDFRGRGYGLRLWRHAINYMGERNIGLDGVLAQQDNYKKSGFKFAYRNIRFECLAAEDLRIPSSIVSLLNVPFDAVVAYDDSLFPASRPHFLNLWINEPAHICLAVMDDERLAGFGVIRHCQKGFKIGPLFADNPEFAESLFCSLVSHVPNNKHIYLDVPEVNTEAVRLALKYGMVRVFETARMYSKSEPKIEIGKLFGVTSFELG